MKFACDRSEAMHLAVQAAVHAFGRAPESVAVAAAAQLIERWLGEMRKLNPRFTPSKM